VVVGLGNPGPAYRHTRHNIGQAVLDRLARRLETRFQRRSGASLAIGRWGTAEVVLAKPDAFMNVVGPSVGRLLRELDCDPRALIVVHDDLDLPFGRVRIRMKGRHGGHNGVRSLIETLGTTAFRRVKVGVGRPGSRDEVVDWVLTPFSPEEEADLPAIVELAADRVLELIGAWTG
jgi:PTH1 family peptidyl-tRNA hydrolase